MRKQKSEKSFPLTSKKKQQAQTQVKKKITKKKKSPPTHCILHRILNKVQQTVQPFA